MACPQQDEDAASTTSSSSMKRSPLTPIAVDGHRATEDPKLALSPSYSSFSESHSADELRQHPTIYQRRKSSIPGLAISRPSSHRRRSHNRRLSPARNSPAVPASLMPVHPNFNAERRASLPSLRLLETVNATPLHLDTRTPQHRDGISEDMYGALQSFTFGAPPRHHSREFYDDDEDEDERQRRDRAKMRAIDDGTRRPSLPTNSSTPVAPRSQPSLSSLSSAGIVVGERQWDEHSEPDWDIAMGDITPTKASPPPPPSSSGNVSIRSEPRRPSVPVAIPMLRRRSRSADELAVDFDQRMRASTPTQASLSTPTPLFSWVERRQSRDDNRGPSSSPEENAYEGYDLDFILSQNPASATGDSQLRHQASTGILRGKFRSKARNAIQSRFEDTFMQHVVAADPVHSQRQAEWTFRRDMRFDRPAAASIKSKDKDRTSKVPDDTEYWRCEWVGSFRIVKLRSEKGESRSAPSMSDVSKAQCTRLQIVHNIDEDNKANKLGGPHAMVHRHSRAQAFSIFRSCDIHPKNPTGSVLLAVKSVLREYTRTESTRALKTHGLTDDGDSRPQQSRSGSGSGGGSPQERSRSKSSTRPRGNTVHEHGAQAVDASSVNRSTTTSASSHSTQQSSAKSHSQSPEARSRKLSTRNVSQPIVSRPTTASSTSTSHPYSLALTESSHTPNFSSVSSSVEYVPPVPQGGPPSPRSPRTSTSHAEAFAMIDPDALDWYHRNNSGPFRFSSSTRVAPPHVASLPPPATLSPPHSQRSAFGFVKRAFGSKQQQQQQKEQKEPGSPVTDDGEDEPKTGNQDGKFEPPWLTVARRSEKERHELAIRTLNNSFESVGLIPPQDKKKTSKPRSNKGSKGEECPVLDGVPEDSMCMLLPLWPEDTDLSTQSQSQGLSRQSSRSARHSATKSLGYPSVGTSVPMQERRFLLVYYAQLSEAVVDNESGNNKKRRRPQTAGERPQHPGHPRTSAAPGAFYVVGRLLTYDDVRSSGVRLPENGLSVTGVLAEAAMAVPIPTLNEEVIAICQSKEDGVELVHDGLTKLGLVEPHENDENAKLSEVGRAIVEMVWCGCAAFLCFNT